MKKINAPQFSGGVLMNADGTPNTRAVYNMIVALNVQLNSLADDIEWIKAHLQKTEASVPKQLGSVASTLSRQSKMFVPTIK